MRIDSHQHFWKYNAVEFGWIDGSMAVLRRDYLPDALAPILKANGFGGTVAVQARRTLAECEFLLDLADQSPFILGVVGWVDFRSPDLADELARYAAREKFCGVREQLQDIADPSYAISDEHLRGISLLGQFGLRYDLLIRPRQIPAAIELVERFPNQLFVVDHVGKPDIASGGLSPWREGLQSLAKYENVYCKLSGLVTEAPWHDWRPAQLWPYLDVVCEAFGPGRTMIGSDWPVCMLAGSYEEVVGVVCDYVSKLSSTERAAILGETCAQFYGLDPLTAPVT